MSGALSVFSDPCAACIVKPAPLRETRFDVFAAGEPYLIATWARPGLLDLLEHGGHVHRVLMGSSRIDQVREDDPQVATAMFAVSHWRIFHNRMIAGFRQKVRGVKQMFPVLQSIGIIAQSAGHATWTPQVCAFGFPAVEMCA